MELKDFIKWYAIVWSICCVSVMITSMLTEMHMFFLSRWWPFIFLAIPFIFILVAIIILAIINTIKHITRNKK